MQPVVLESTSCTRITFIGRGFMSEPVPDGDMCPYWGEGSGHSCQKVDFSCKLQAGPGIAISFFNLVPVFVSVLSFTFLAPFFVSPPSISGFLNHSNSFNIMLNGMNACLSHAVGTSVSAGCITPPSGSTLEINWNLIHDGEPYQAQCFSSFLTWLTYVCCSDSF